MRKEECLKQQNTACWYEVNAGRHKLDPTLLFFNRKRSKTWPRMKEGKFPKKIRKKNDNTYR